MFEYEVPGLVPPIPQPYTMACWATVSTSMISWRDSASYTIEEVMDRVGPKYRKIYEDNTGLFPVDTPELLQELTLVAEPPEINYSIDRWQQLLQDYGPLWVTVAPDPN
ncbi:papain-like cysteine protease family protein [Peribacillus butanolivorans]|uniref:papain-like cysteine protease family protein n=1 Tax=Peribacillus butanolivorans TaxID=421767 RepID=UPI003628ABFC